MIRSSQFTESWEAEDLFTLAGVRTKNWQGKHESQRSPRLYFLVQGDKNQIQKLVEHLYFHHQNS